ncbi:hypothetical protein P2318_14380 [Myxococcaceae bacterium GXIMD 01537]
MKKLLVSMGLCAAVGAACVISVEDFAGKTCESVDDCPVPYTCVAARPGQGRTCEVLAGPFVSDAGEPDTGPVPTYCQDIQPILAANCVSSCHGADHSDGTAGFRLDYYEPPGGVGEPGARAKADRIKARASDFRTMPPVGNPAPTPAERALLSRWARGGAPLCDDGGTPDGGVDGGP